MVCYGIFWSGQLALRQRSIYFRSLLIWDSRSGIVAAEKVTLVSSAYILGEPTFKQFGRSED